MNYKEESQKLGMLILVDRSTLYLISKIIRYYKTLRMVIFNRYQ